MKKVLKVLMSIMVILIVIGITSSVRGEEIITTAITTDKSELETGETITANITINKFTREGTSRALEGKLEYDSTKLEYVSHEYQYNWNGTISSDKTGIVANKSTAAGISETFLKITFKVKEGATGSTSIGIKDIITSVDGDEVKAQGTSKTITIKQIVEPNQSSTTEPNQSSTTEPNQSSTKNKSLPKTGKTEEISLICIVAVISAILYIRYKNIF